jgi:tRNA nucleotidyltransferase (CCA-adding enzyme)
MAIRLDKDSFGELLDYYGGERDLEEGLIRVLHNLSFIEDPIRMLRAVRLEQRLGFQIEQMTEELISDALEWLDRVGGERVRQELHALFQEELPVRPLRRLAELGILHQIHPALVWDRAMEEAVAKSPAALREWQAQRVTEEPVAERQAVSRMVLYLALVSVRATARRVDDLASRLKLPNNAAHFLEEVSRLTSVLPALADPKLTPSGIYHLLCPFSDQAIFVCRLAAEDDVIRHGLELYHRELASVKPLVDGDDLKRMGLPPGPRYREILDALRNAWLEGEIRTLEEEKALVRTMMAGQDTDVKGEA